jgi:hypothetical protein
MPKSLSRGNASLACAQNALSSRSIVIGQRVHYFQTPIAPSRLLSSFFKILRHVRPYGLRQQIASLLGRYDAPYVSIEFMDGLFNSIFTHAPGTWQSLPINKFSWYQRHLHRYYEFLGKNTWALELVERLNSYISPATPEAFHSLLRLLGMLLNEKSSLHNVFSQWISQVELPQELPKFETDGDQWRLGQDLPSPVELGVLRRLITPTAIPQQNPFRHGKRLWELAQGA